MEEKVEQAEKKTMRSDAMRNMPVGKLLIKMSLPAIFSMLVQALYNVVDTLFIASYSEITYGYNAGTTALSAALPMQYLIIAFAVGVGIGTNVAISRKLGEKKNDEANAIARNGVFMSVVCAIVFIALAFVISRPFISLFSGGDELVEDLGTTYITICMSLSFGCFIEITLSKILQGTGNMKIPMISQLIGAITNIILDPLLIYGIWIFPELGVAGAGIATVTGQILSMTFVIVMFIIRTHDVKIDFKKFKPCGRTICLICAIGAPTMVMNAVSSFTVTFMNMILVDYNNGIAILGVYFKMQSFVFMPVFGLMQGLMPILSYNYGSHNKKRYKDAFVLAVIIAIGVMTAGMILFLTCAELIMKLFSASGEYLVDGAYALRIMSLAFIFAGIGIPVTTGLQTLGNGIKALLQSIFRQIGLVVPIAIFLASLFGLQGIWFSYPIAEITVAIIFLPMFIVSYKKSFPKV